MALEHRLAAEPHPGDRAERQAQRMPVAKADDLAGELASAAGGLDQHPAADPEFAHRSDDFDQQALHRFDAAEHLDLVEHLDGGGQGLQSGPSSESF